MCIFCYTIHTQSQWPKNHKPTILLNAHESWNNNTQQNTTPHPTKQVHLCIVCALEMNTISFFFDSIKLNRSRAKHLHPSELRGGRNVIYLELFDLFLSLQLAATQIFQCYLLFCPNDKLKFYQMAFFSATFRNEKDIFVWIFNNENGEWCSFLFKIPF